jgi:hydrogenase nickel incorporation protein HypA/HybF
MHESSLARQILSVVLERAAGERAVAVRRVRGWIAETEALSRESIAFHFAVLAVGTIAAGAILELEVHHVEAQCRGCRATYRPEHHVLLCPVCGRPDADLSSDTGLAIESIDVSVEDSA